jgi:NAD(P)-dependent dehydrogenase (short-subunit alcohol dehydrogenase family)
MAVSEQRSTAPWSAFDLSGRRALVTGAARGIGRAAATALGRHGAELILADVRGEDVGETAGELLELGVAAQPVHADVRSADDIGRLSAMTAGLGGVDILVNCAGVIGRAVTTESTVEDLDVVWEVNMRGLYAVTQALLPQLLASDAGRIINVGSLGSVIGLEQRAAYAATKGAVLQYTRSLAVDLGRHGVCVNAVAPGYIETHMSSGWLVDDAERRERMLERILLGRFGQPADVEGAFVFLAAPASGYMTGQVVVVDGGWSSW